MSALELDDSGARHIDELAASKGVPLGTPVDAGAFDGMFTASGKGLMRGLVAKPAKLVGDAAAPVVRPMVRAIDSAFGTNAVTDYFEGELKKNDKLLDDLKADPGTTGFAGQLLHSLFDIGGSALVLTPEGAAVMEGYTRQQELIAKGVDPGTATAAGTVSGAALFAGVKAPMTMGTAAVGRGVQGVAANVSVGAGTNLAAGIAERGFTHDLLSRAGFAEMAEQYKPYDTQSMMTEIALGTIFSGGIGAIEARSAKSQAALNAALTVNNAMHAARDTAPGVPVDAKSSAAHQSALGTAIEQALRGEPVNVSDAITEAEFVRPASAAPERPIAAAIRDAYRDVLPAEARHAPSDRLTQIPVDQRRGLRFDAPELNEFAASIEQKYSLPGGLINALKNAGEKSGSTAVSPAGARGVMQFMPENLKKYGVTDASDPAQIIDAAGRYLRDTMKQYDGNVDAVIADYNGGPRQARRVLNGEAPAAAETRAYLARVKEYLGRQDQPVRQAKQTTPEEFATSLGRVAEVHPETGAPTFRDGTAYSGEQILPFFEQALTNQPIGAAVPDVLFRIGRIDGQVAAGLKQFVPEFDGNARDARISAQVIDQIRQLQPETVRDLLTRLEEGALYADEVLPNPQNADRALLTLRDGADEGRPVVILDVATSGKSIDVMSVRAGTASDLEPAAELKRQIEASRSKEPKATKTGFDPESPGKWADTRAGDTQPDLLHPTGQGKPAESSLPDGLPRDYFASGQGATADAPDRAQSASQAAVKGNSTPHISEAQTLDLSTPTREAGTASVEMQEVRDARAIAEELGDMVIALDDGTAMTARDALAQADEVIAQAKNDALAFDAAITCFLRKGS